MLFRSRAALPELAFPALAACAGPLPWTAFIGPVDGLNFWHGAGFSALNFLVALFLLVTSGAGLARTRALAVLLTGLAGLALVLWWNAVPVQPIGNSTMTFTRKPALAGVWLGASLAVLTAITGALRLRAAIIVRSSGGGVGSEKIEGKAGSGDAATMARAGTADLATASGWNSVLLWGGEWSCSSS